jgi:hypothetical protein
MIFTEAQLLKMFGCRLHGIHECPHCAPEEESHRV